jgi:hypothetical protein
MTSPPGSTGALERVKEAAADAAAPLEGYAPPEERPPFGGYAALATTYNLGLAAFLAAGRRGTYSLPEEISLKDLALVGVATHKLSRIVAKDKVTSFARAPFRRYEGRGGPAEMSEETRGTGLRAAFGEFIGCPYCLALWISTALTGGLVLAPRETRFLTAAFTGVAISDFMQIAYKAGQELLE